MRALARILVLIERRAIELRQRPGVARKVRRDPIHDDPDARPMQGVDEKLEIIWRAIAAGGRVKAGDLIAPRRIIGMLGDRQKLHVREPGLLDVCDERRSDLAVAE